MNWKRKALVCCVAVLCTSAMLAFTPPLIQQAERVVNPPPAYNQEIFSSADDQASSSSGSRASNATDKRQVNAVVNDAYGKEQMLEPRLTTLASEAPVPIAPRPVISNDKGTVSREARELPCPADSLYAQPAHGIDDTWTFGVSDVSFPAIRYESFSGVSGDICDAHWWGCEIDYGNNNVNCSPGAGDFDVILYADAGGMPGAVVGSYTVSPVRTFTGETYLAGGGTIPLDVFEYSVVLTPCTTLSAGWVSIQSLSPETCSFWWLTSEFGDGESLLDTGTGPAVELFDLSLCLTGQYVPTFGACCDDDTGVCTDNVEQIDCTPPLRFAADILCANLDPSCGQILGACCFPDQNNPDFFLCEQKVEADCQGAEFTWLEGVPCEPDPCNVPYCDNCYSNTGDRCDCVSGGSPDDWITNVTFNTINNDTCSENNGCSYGDYTGLSTIVVPTQTYTLSVTFCSEGIWTQYVTAWFDWNKDRVFDDATERYDVGSGIDATVTADITIPANAQGFTRMRVVERYSSYPPNACESYSYGETEDYTLQMGEVVGACCHTDGTCSEVLPSACDGTYAGPFTSCAGDCDGDGVSDICELLGGAPDCNGNGLPDNCDLDPDCNANGIPDECELEGNDCNENGIPDDCEPGDCDGNGTPDACDPDCNENGITDGCDIEGAPASCGDCYASYGTIPDCQPDGIPDDCQVGAFDGGGRDVLVSQLPNQTNGIFCDCNCDFCGSGVQVLVENFTLDAEATLGTIRFWGGHYPGDGTPPGSFNVIFYADGGGAPGAEVYNATLTASTQSQTGIVLFGVHEIVTELVVTPSLTLGAGTHWMAVIADSVGDTDSWFWEVGDLDGAHGIIGQGWGTTCPPTYPNYDAATDLAFELETGGGPGPSGGDCNENGIPDDCDIANGTSADCQPDGIPDECQLVGNDCNADEVPDDCQLAGNDCNGDGVPDDCQLANNDCNGDSIPDDCQLDGNDCNEDGTPDDCQLAGNDCNNNGIPDDCEPDCNENGVADGCDIANGTSLDCQPDGVPDECQLGPPPPPEPCEAGMEDAVIHIEILTDSYGSETSFELVEDPTGIVVASAAPFSLSSNTFYEWFVDVCSTSCYTFTIHDSYGDGICCAYGSGYYNVSYNGGLVATGGDFGSVDVVSNIGGQCGEEARAAAAITIFTSARGLTAPTNQLFVLDETGLVTGAVDQIGSCGSDAWGYRDGCSDGEFVYFGCGSGLFRHSAVDGSGGESYISGGAPGGVGTWRAMAYNPDGDGGNGSFWTASFSSALVETDRSGNVLTNHANNDGWSLYGLAWDHSTGMLWGHDSGSLHPQSFVREIDPATGSVTGVWFPTDWGFPPSPIQGGLSMTDSGTLFGVQQATPDTLFSCDTAGNLTGPVDPNPRDLDIQTLETGNLGVAVVGGAGGPAGEGGDCNQNGTPDDCDIQYCGDDEQHPEWCVTGDPFAWCQDCNEDGVPDGCQQDPDCNADCVPDDCQLVGAPPAPCVDPDAMVQIVIMTDAYGGETSWELDDCAGTVASVPGFSLSSNTLYTWDVPVCSDQCYTFTIHDSYGDGICCSYGAGFYEVWYEGALIGTGGAFGSIDIVGPFPDGCSCDGTSNDCNDDGIPDDCQLGENDCNGNGEPDDCDIAGGFSIDCDENGVPDECQSLDDCNGDGTPDICDPDCNENGTSDVCDMWDCPPGETWCDDCQPDGILDACQLGGEVAFKRGAFIYQHDDGTTENSLGLTAGGEMCWIQRYIVEPGEETIGTISTTFGTPAFPGGSGVTAGDPFRVYVWDDPNGDGNVSDAVLLSETAGTVEAGAIESDVPMDLAIDPVTITSGSFFIGTSYEHGAGFYVGPMDDDGPQAHESWVDFNSVPYDPNLVTAALFMDDIGFTANWMLRAGTGTGGGGPGADCNGNTIPDDCDIMYCGDPELSAPHPEWCATGDPYAWCQDCNGDEVPDGCQEDCNDNCVPDDCDLTNGTSQDCNGNEIPDECDIANGTSLDCQPNGIPDECEEDCNGNDIPDDCDIANCGDLTVGGCDDPNAWCQDCQNDGVLDDCQLGLPPVGPCQPGTEDAVITVSILTDNYGGEVTWSLVEQSTGITVAAGGPYGNATLYVIDVPVCSYSCYDWTIFDSFGDGICCSYGIGEYNIYYNGDLIATGGEYGSSETVSNIGGAGCGGGGGGPEACVPGEEDATITVEILTDNYGGETTWELSDQAGGVVASGGPYPNATLITVDVAVCSYSCYDWTIFDSFGDGICCSYGIGYYNIYYEGDLVGSGGEFGDSETVGDIGGGCGGGGGGAEPCVPGEEDATITVEILTDNYGGETTWELSDQAGGVVASGGPYPNATLITVDVAVCSYSCYDWTIFDSFGDGICCSYGIGYYNIYYEGDLVGSGGEFGDSETVSDIGGGCGGGGGGGAEPCVPGEEDATITVEILTDNYGGETTWELADQNGGVVASGGPYPNATLITVDVAVCSYACYDWTIFDSFGDGICCAYGIGYYNIYYEGDLVATGGEFGDSETVSDIGGGCGGGGGGGGAEECVSGEEDATITVEILTDNYGGETTWELADQNGGVVASGGPYSGSTLYTIDVAVCSYACYDFTIYDSYGDGICCSYGAGYYNIYYEGDLVATGGEFGDSETVTDIGAGCGGGGGGGCGGGADCIDAVHPNQQPNQSNGIFSDSDCDFCSAGVQFLAEQLVPATGADLVGLKIWGGYYPGNNAGAAPNITVIVHEDSGGSPGAEISNQTNVPTTRFTTGVVLFGVEEWELTIDIAPVEGLCAGDLYWVQIFENTVGNSDSFFWEVGNLDAQYGVVGQAWRTTGSWNFDSATDMAVEMTVCEAPSGPPPTLSNDCNSNCVPDECDPDCDGDGIPDDCDEVYCCITCPDDMTVECDGMGNVDDLNAWLDSLVVFSTEGGCASITDNFTGLSDECGQDRSATVTWVAVDADGLVLQCSSTFTILASHRTLYIKHVGGHGPCPPRVYPLVGDDDDDDDCERMKVMLVGDVDFDVWDVDVTTLELRRCDGLGGFVNPCADGMCVGEGDDDDDDNDPCLPNRGIFKYRDRNQPNPADVGCGEGQLPCACGDDDDDDDDDCSRGGDDDDDDCVPHGHRDCITDLEAKVRLDSMINAGLLQGAHGEVVSLYLCGELYNGCKFSAVDCVMLWYPTGGVTMRLNVRANSGTPWVDVWPPDELLETDGQAEFDRFYPGGTAVILTPEPTVLDLPFLAWEVDGVRVETPGGDLEVVVDLDGKTVEAVYGFESMSGDGQPTQNAQRQRRNLDGGTGEPARSSGGSSGSESMSRETQGGTPNAQRGSSASR